MNLINCLAQVVANHFRFLVYYLNPVVTERSSKYQQQSDRALTKHV